MQAISLYSNDLFFPVNKKINCTQYYVYKSGFNIPLAELVATII